MQYAKITILFLLVFIVFNHTDASLNRRRRRKCTPRACEVSSWSSWSSCSAEQCVQHGSQRRTRTEESSPSCGGSECPELEETRQCYGTRSVDCQLSSWSEWSACSTPCGLSGIQSSVRHRVVNEQCGGRCTSTFRKTRACVELSCRNGGSLKGGTCFCKEGHSGVCCEKGLLKESSSESPSKSSPKSSSESKKLPAGIIVLIVFIALGGGAVMVYCSCQIDCCC